MSQKPSDISVIVYRLLFLFSACGFLYCLLYVLVILIYYCVIFNLLLFLISALIRCCGMVFVVLSYYCIMWYVLFVVDEESLSISIFKCCLYWQGTICKRDYSLNITPLVK